MPIQQPAEFAAKRQGKIARRLPEFGNPACIGTGTQKEFDSSKIGLPQRDMQGCFGHVSDRIHVRPRIDKTLYRMCVSTPDHDM